MATLSSKVSPSGVATAAQGASADSAVQPNDSPTFGTVTADGLTVDTDTLYVDSANNRVGIGTSSPSGQDASANNLVVEDAAGNGGITIKTPTSAYGSLHFSDGTGVDAYRGILAYNHSDNSMQFHANATEAARFDSSGNLLVGRTSSSGFTTSSGSAHFPNGSIFATVDGGQALNVSRLTSDGSLVGFYKDGSAVGSISARSSFLTLQIGSTGTGITGTSSHKILPSVNNARSDNTNDLGDSSYRWKDLYLSGTANAANFNTTSDATLKTNVDPLTGSLDAVKSLRGVSFDWIENGGSEVGFIAQEVEEVLPEVVSTNDQGIKSVKYGNMVALLVEAMKEQQAQIDELKAQLNS